MFALVSFVHSFRKSIITWMSYFSENFCLNVGILSCPRKKFQKHVHIAVETAIAIYACIQVALLRFVGFLEVNSVSFL